MHIFFSTLMFGSFMLFSVALAICCTPLAIACAIISLVSALILRALSDNPAQPLPTPERATHYQTDYHHHYTNPTHYHHGRPGR